ncbi:MAG: hypothetical protein D3919_16490, partial [Candidatus Electrothrix sp. AW5]|nr:hypothetical protein [Candidatus Electrothrix gigas]
MEIFEQKRQNWVVFLRVRLPVIRYTEHLEKQGIFLTKGPSEDLEAHSVARLLKKEREGFVGYDTYVKVVDNKSFDPINARNNAELRLRTFFNAYNFLDHKTKINIHPSCLVVSGSEESKEIFLRAKPHPMERASCRNEVPLNELVKSFDSLFRNFSSEAIDQLFRVFDYHSSAISSENPESQLISLWAALEGLFPPPVNGKRGISYYLNLTLPSLVLTYPEKIFRYVEDAIRYSEKEVRDIIDRDGKGESFFEKTIYYL